MDWRALTPQGIRVLQRDILGQRLFQLRAAAVLCLGVFAAVSVSTSEVILFGPETYVRDTGQPTTITKSFRVATPTTPTLRLWNYGVTSAVISVNGQNVLAPSDFTGDQKDGSLLERRVALRAGDNTIDVELRSKPGTSVVIEIVGLTAPGVSDLEPSRLTVLAGGMGLLPP